MGGFLKNSIIIKDYDIHSLFVHLDLLYLSLYFTIVKRVFLLIGIY
jgi:hypothetical protein